MIGIVLLLLAANLVLLLVAAYWKGRLDGLKRGRR